MTRTHRLLLALLVFQGVVFVGLWLSRGTATAGPSPGEIFLVGDTFNDLPLNNERVLSVGRTADAEWTLVLAFSAGCQWCDSVAPNWQELTTRGAPRLRIVGVTRDVDSLAETYVRRHRWRFDLLVAAADSSRGSIGGQLTGKTPWFYLFDSTGTLHGSGHGASAQATIEQAMAGQTKGLSQ